MDRRTLLVSTLMLVLLGLTATGCGESAKVDPTRSAPDEIQARRDPIEKDTAARVHNYVDEAVTRGRLNRVLLESPIHGGFPVDLYMSETAEAFYLDPDVRTASTGTVIVARSWQTTKRQSAGPTWIMVKEEPGYDPEFSDWFYARISPEGLVDVAGQSSDPGAMQCIVCHAGKRDDDFIYQFGPPEEYRRY